MAAAHRVGLCGGPAPWGVIERRMSSNCSLVLIGGAIYWMVLRRCGAWPCFLRSGRRKPFKGPPKARQRVAVCLCPARRCLAPPGRCPSALRSTAAVVYQGDNLRQAVGNPFLRCAFRISSLSQCRCSSAPPCHDTLSCRIVASLPLCAGDAWAEEAGSAVRGEHHR